MVPICPLGGSDKVSNGAPQFTNPNRVAREKCVEGWRILDGHDLALSRAKARHQVAEDVSLFFRGSIREHVSKSTKKRHESLDVVVCHDDVGALCVFNLAGHPLVLGCEFHGKRFRPFARDGSVEDRGFKVVQAHLDCRALVLKPFDLFLTGGLIVLAKAFNRDQEEFAETVTCHGAREPASHGVFNCVGPNESPETAAGTVPLSDATVVRKG